MGFWKDIFKESNRVKENWKSRIINGTRIRFWKAYQCRSTALNLTFPSLFALVVNKSETVEEVWDLSNGRVSWKPTFACDFNNWEVDMVASFLNALQKERVSIELDSVS